jgi:hypothetical protein
MKLFSTLILVSAVALGFAQGHDNNTGADKLKDIGFIVGSWSGKQNFQTGPGQTMAADITSTVSQEVEGKFIQEKTTTTLPGGKQGSAIHLLSYDAKDDMYKVWWFNDTSAVPQMLEGKFDGTKLVMNTLPDSKGPTFRATYTKGDGAWTYQLEMKRADSWVTLFVTNYGKA